MSNVSPSNIEKIKKEKSGIDILGDIYYHAVFGEKISAEDLERFKWYGIYSLNENNDSFKLKIPLSLGELNLTQLKKLALILKVFPNDSIEFSSEQKIEINNIKFFDLPAIFNFLKEVDLITHFESGHNVRRVLTCPINGIDDTQILDVEQFAKKMNNTFVSNKEFENLPNKLQFAISGYEEGCSLPFTPDISFNAIKDTKNKIFFRIKVLDSYIGFITPAQVVKTAIAIANIYKDYGERADLEKSSFEYLIKNWGLNKFFDILNSSINYKIQKNILIKSENQTRKSKIGIYDSKIENQSYIGCKVNSSSIEKEKIELLASLLEKYNASKIKITHKGNIVVLDAPKDNAYNFAKELENIDFSPFDK